MARLRKFVAYRSLERPYTRVSKYRKKAYVRASMRTKVIRFDMGNPNKKFKNTLDLKTKASLQIRDNALESARQTCLKILEKKVGNLNFHFKILSYPFHVLRENPLASGAGADRFSTGMQKSFGKPIGMAVQLKKGQTIFQIKVDKEHLPTAKEALRRAYTKMPCSFLIETVK